MVTVKKLTCLSFMQSKVVPIPEDMVVSHGGLEYLKVRPSHYKILQIICGQKTPKKNSSLSDSPALAALKKKRDAAWQEQVNSQVGQEDAENMGMPNPDQERPRKKAKSAPNEPEVVQIDVNGSSVQILCPASKVSRSDFQVLMQPSNLEPLFQCLTGDCNGTPEAQRGQHTEATEGRKYCSFTNSSANIQVTCLIGCHARPRWLTSTTSGTLTSKVGSMIWHRCEAFWFTTPHSHTHSLYAWPGWGCHLTWWMWAIGKSFLLLSCTKQNVQCKLV